MSEERPERILSDPERFIPEFKKFSCLWDTQNENYNNKVSRRNAYESICQALTLPVTDESIKQIKSKINILRSSFSRELVKIAKYRKGSSTGQQPSSSWRWFKALEFLRPHVSIRQGPSSFDIEWGGEDDQLNQSSNQAFPSQTEESSLAVFPHLDEMGVFSGQPVNNQQDAPVFAVFPDQLHDEDENSCDDRDVDLGSIQNTPLQHENNLGSITCTPIQYVENGNSVHRENPAKRRRTERAATAARQILPETRQILPETRQILPETRQILPEDSLKDIKELLSEIVEGKRQRRQDREETRSKHYHFAMDIATRLDEMPLEMALNARREIGEVMFRHSTLKFDS